MSVLTFWLRKGLNFFVMYSRNQQSLVGAFLGIPIVQKLENWLRQNYSAYSTDCCSKTKFISQLEEQNTHLFSDEICSLFCKRKLGHAESSGCRKHFQKAAERKNAVCSSENQASSLEYASTLTHSKPRVYRHSAIQHHCIQDSHKH